MRYEIEDVIRRMRYSVRKGTFSTSAMLSTIKNKALIRVN